MDMADPSRYTEDKPEAPRRWGRIVVIILLLVALVMIVIMLATGGEHGPARHFGEDVPAGHIPPPGVHQPPEGVHP
jgi:hypothetical protein